MILYEQSINKIMIHHMSRAHLRRQGILSEHGVHEIWKKRHQHGVWEVIWRNHSSFVQWTLKQEQRNKRKSHWSCAVNWLLLIVWLPFYQDVGQIARNFGAGGAQMAPLQFNGNQLLSCREHIDRWNGCIAQISSPPHGRRQTTQLSVPQNMHKIAMETPMVPRLSLCRLKWHSQIWLWPGMNAGGVEYRWWPTGFIWSVTEGAVA